MNNNYKQLKIKKKKQAERIKDEDEDMEAFHRRLRGEIPREKKSIFKTIIKDNKSKNAEEETERLEKLSDAINYDKLFIADNKGKKIINFSNYMDLDMFARKYFYESISLKEAKKTR